MKTVNLRIFVTTSHISTVYMTMLAGATREENQHDILLIDAGKRKQGLIDLITQTSQLHDWSVFHDFSIPTGENFDYVPSTRKTILRKSKTWPVIKNIYAFLLQRHLKSEDERYREELKNLFKAYEENNMQIDLFLLTQTYLNRPLQQLFPAASINYMEHGIGDYYYLSEPQTKEGNFYCVFAETYKRYLAKNGKSADRIKQLPGISFFPELAERLLSIHRQLISANELPHPEKPCVFILLEAVDMYHVHSSFWAAYLDKIFSQLVDAEKFHYLLKPHPMQSEKSIEATKNHINKLGFSYSLLNQPSLINASAEVLFSLWAKKTQHVFCLFSSGCFYLSKLYANEKIKFWYSTEFMNKHIANAPPQYYKAFTKSRILIEEVFSENCTPY